MPEAGREYYVELTDTYVTKDCSDFVIQNVLPQLDLSLHGQTLSEAQASLLAFLSNRESPLEIYSDAPDWDWDLFCQLAYVNHRWPANVTNRATNLIQLFRHLEADDIGNVDLDAVRSWGVPLTTLDQFIKQNRDKFVIG